MLEKLYYVGELVGVLALVISVLYLAKQVKTSNDLNRTNTFRSIFQGFADYCNDVFGPGNAVLMVKAYRDIGSLSPDERMTFDMSMTNLLNYVEDSWASSQVDLLRDVTMENWSWWLCNRVFPYPGAREWWAESKGIWPDEFQSWIEGQIRNSDPKSDAYGIVVSRE